MYSTKGISVVVGTLLCITLFATTALARPVVDTSKQQIDVSSSGAQAKPEPEPDFFWFRPRPRLPGSWRWFIPPHKPGFAPAPHGAPHSFPKWPWAHPPFPHFPIPKKPHDHSAFVVDAKEQVDSTALSGAQVHPDFFFGRRPMLPWWLIIHPQRRPHKPWFPLSPHGAPHKFPKWPWAHPPLPHFPTPKKPPAGLKATRGNDVEAAAIEKCLSPLAAVEHCVYDIVSAFTTSIVEFDSACCSAINQMESDCVASFDNQKFTDALSSYCSAH